MKRKWENHELIEHWTIDTEERELIRKKKGANRLGFALLLKFFQLKGRFPEKKNEIPRVVQAFVAEQLGLSVTLYQEYNWQGRAIKHHRAEIREITGFRPIRMSDFEELRQWLIDKVLPQEVDERGIKQSFYGELRARKIEPPTYAQVERLLNSAQRQFEVHLCTSMLGKLSEPCRRELDALTGPQEDSYLLDPEQIPLNRLKAEAGGVSLKSLKAELEKLELIRKVGLAEDLFCHLCESIVERYRLRVETESLTELRRHPTPVRYTLLAVFCWVRSQEIIDNVVELLIQLMHRMESRSKKKVSEEVVAKSQGQDGHTKVLYQIALASLAEPEGLVKDVIYPIAGEEQLAQLIECLDKTEGNFRERLQARFRSAYSYHYRRMMPQVLKALEFRSQSPQMKPLMESLELLKTYADKPHNQPYADDVNVPMDGVLSQDWQAAVMKTGADGEPQVDRVAYEIGVLRTVREKLRCKELWVTGAKRYRNPDEDLPQDFEERREAYYQDLQQPLEVESFIAQIQHDMAQALEQLNRGLPKNPKVRLLDKRGGWIHLTPLEEQPEPEHLRRLKAEINHRWSTLPLLDVLKETEFRLNFTTHFRSAASRETLDPDELRKRLLLCLYALGTNLGLNALLTATTEPAPATCITFVVNS